jgi:hypothetical protein
MFIQHIFFDGYFLNRPEQYRCRPQVVRLCAQDQARERGRSELRVRAALSSPDVMNGRFYFIGESHIVMREPASNQPNYLRGFGASPKETSMSERHWEEEQRSVLGRLLDFIFGRLDASEEKIDNEIPWLHALRLASRQDQHGHESAARSAGKGARPAGSNLTSAVMSDLEAN